MTIIGPSLVITGEVISREDITLHGQINGQVQMDAGSLLVAPKGCVDGDVDAVRVTVHGTVAGTVAASERLELTATASVTGTLAAPALVLQDGATFNGTIAIARQAMKDRKERPLAAVPRAS